MHIQCFKCLSRNSTLNHKNLRILSRHLVHASFLASSINSLCSQRAQLINTRTCLHTSLGCIRCKVPCPALSTTPSRPHLSCTRVTHTRGRQPTTAAKCLGDSCCACAATAAARRRRLTGGGTAFIPARAHITSGRCCGPREGI
jgi:hypothetical protein